MGAIEKIVGFIKKSGFVILALIISQIVSSSYGRIAGEAVFWLITGVISGIKYLKRREAKALIDTYLVEKNFKDYKLLNVEQKENGLWRAECMVLDYEKYYDDLKFDVELDTWSGRYFDNFTEKEQEHLLEYSDREKQLEAMSVIQEEAADIQEEVFETI
ncbi:hypothetical protein ACPWSR_09050 [Alloiococcus sp. CFN-8]|uniref:hypothetical protein n=1 Tax=Alloiococcus sp. CFN-8 TaxID=3416081 RepID=UPI003CF11538